MGLTKAQANSRLKTISTADELRELIRQLDVYSKGTKTILWSGAAGVYGNEVISSAQMATAIETADRSFRSIGQTEAASFLELDRSKKNFNQELANKLKEIFKNDPAGHHEFLYGAMAGDPQKRVGSGIWDDVSENFVKQASGDVRLIVGGASLDRIFAQTEIHALLANPAIRSVEGVPIEGLRDLARSSGIERVLQLLMGLSEANTGMIQIAVDRNGRPLQNIDGSYRVDASDFLKMNTLHTRALLGMRSVMEFIPEERRVRHTQAVEEIFNLHPILRSRNIALPVSRDLFQHQFAAARLSTYMGRISDVHSLSSMLAEAGWHLHRGDHRNAHHTVTSWVAENAGGFAAGRIASLLVAPLMATGPLGMIIGAGIIIGASLGGADLAKKLHQQLRDRFRELENTVSPLILDLDGNGVLTLSLGRTPIHFDHDGNGFAERTGWVDPNDGLLVLDLNQNGRVDNGSELFGNHTRLANGDLASNGFEALARYDSNKDRKIDSSDPVWSRLLIWRDRNSNAISESNELHRLDTLNIRSLQLQYQSSTEVDANGNAHREKGFFEQTNGKLARLTDVWFARDTLKSQQLIARPVDAATASLPNLAGIGIVPSLHQALMAPEASKLRETFTRWLKGTRQQKIELRMELLLQWCDASNSPFCNEDRYFGSGDPLIKEKTAVVEKMMGVAIRDTNEIVGSNKARIITALVSEIAVLIDLMLSAQVHLQPLLSLDPKSAADHLRSQFTKDPDPTLPYLVQWLSAQRGTGGLAFFESLRQTTLTRADALGIAMRSLRPLTGKGEWIGGTARDDVLSGGAQDDFVEGGAGYDVIRAHDGNDILHGGPGSDICYGGAGMDTYIISQNGVYDFDQIFDAASPSGQADRIVFSDISSSNIRLLRQSENVCFFAGQQLVAVVEQQLNPQHRIEEFHFADGVIWDHNNLLLQLPIEGTSGNDRLIGTPDASNRLQGLAGNDTLLGGAFADHLEGQQDNDLLTGLAGADILDGGEGNDTLEGGEGGDRYLFAANGGHDRILDIDPRHGGTDRVVFTNLASTALTRVQRSSDTLELHFGATTSLTLVNQLQPFSRIEEFQFADGRTWNHTTLLQQVR